MILKDTPAVNAAIAHARSLPDLIGGLQRINPELVAQLETKPLLASRTVWGTLATYAVVWLAGHYGLDWDAGTCGLVAGSCMWLATLALRWITKGPVAGLLRTPAGTPPDVPAT